MKMHQHKIFPHITKIHVEWDKLFSLTLKVGLFKLRTSHEGKIN